MKYFLKILIGFIYILLTSNLKAQNPELIIPATHEARAVVISPDDKWIVSASKEGLKIWDNKTNKLLKNLSPGKKDNDRFGLGELTMVFDNTSSLLAFQVLDTVYFFDFNKFSITSTVFSKVIYNTLKFSNTSVLYGAGFANNNSNEYFIDKIEISAKPISNNILKIPLKENYGVEYLNISLSPFANELLFCDNNHGSWLINLNTNKITKHFKINQSVIPYEYLKNGNILAFADGNLKRLAIAEVDAKTFTTKRKSKALFYDDGSISAINHIKVYPSFSGKIKFTFQATYVVFNINDFSVSSKSSMILGGVTTSKNIALSASSNYFLYGYDMTKYSFISNEAITKIGELPLNTYVQFVFKHIDGVCLKDRILTFENGAFNQRMIEMPVKTNYGFIYRLSNDGKTGFIYNQNWGLYRFNPNKAKLEYESIVKINSMNKEFIGMQIFEAANMLALIGNEGIYLMDLTTLKVLYIVDIPYGLRYFGQERLNKFCDISPDNTKLILFAEGNEGEKNYIYCVDLSDRNEKWKHESTNIENIRFANSGKNISFTSGSKLYFLDAETGKPSNTIVDLPQSEFATIISPSGNIAATKIPINANQNEGFNVGLIDVNNNKSVGTLKGTGDDVFDFVFLKHERYMLTEEYGGLCIWDNEKQRKIGKIYLFENSDDWVFVAADGRFDATPNALKKMYFTKGKEIIPLESLYENYYVPSLLKQIWENASNVVVPSIKEILLPPNVKISLQMQDRNLTVEDDVKILKVDKENVLVKVEADGLKDFVSEIRLYQNGKLVHTTRNLVVEDEKLGEKTLTKTFAVTLNNGDNNFRAVAINSQRTESLPALLMANYKPLIAVPKPQENTIQLHVLVVGVNTYKNPKYSLNYAKADADAFTAALQNGATGLFGKVNLTYVKDDAATKEGIIAAFDKIKTAATSQDLFVFYYAGHGVINDKKEFFLVPYDVVQLYGNDNALAQKGISAAALQQMSKDIKAQKQLFILDACQSAGALDFIATARGAAEEKAIAQLARSTGTQWLTASGSEQFASEFSQLGHGSFTYCLLEAFKGEAGSVEKRLTVKQLDAYLQTKVPEVTQKYKGTPQYPASYSYGNDFPIILIK